MVDISNLIERRTAFEERLGVDVRAVSAFLDKNSNGPYATIRGELHSKSGQNLHSDTKIVAAAHDRAGRIVGTERHDFLRDQFFQQDVFDISITLSTTDIAKISLYPISSATSEDVAIQGQSLGKISQQDEIRLLVEEFGYNAVPTPATDEDVDIIAEKNGRRVAVRAKLHVPGNVGSQVVIDLVRGAKGHGATESLLVTTAQLSTRALAACQESRVVYYDHDRLLKFCTDHQLCVPSWCWLRNISADSATCLDHNISIGRENGNDVVVGNDPLISRRHFRLSWDRLSLWIEDCGSSNGTKVDGQPISKRTRVHYGSVITAGQQKWIVAEQSTLPQTNKALLM